MTRQSTTIGGDWIKKFMQGAVFAGIEPDLLLGEADIDREVYGDRTMRIDGVCFQKLYLIIRDALNDTFIGFMDQPGKLALEREQLRVRLQCITLGEALRTSTQFMEAVRNDIIYTYEERSSDQIYTLGFDFKSNSRLDRHVFHWHRMSLMHRYYSWLIGEKIPLSEVRFEAQQPRSVDEIELYRIFDCNVVFGASDHSFSFSRDLLARPIVHSETNETTDFPVDYPDWFKFPQKITRWERKTEQAIILMQQEGDWTPSLERVANLLSTSSRSLRRRLETEHVSFTEVRMRLRRDLAKALLIGKDSSISSIAYEIGYPSPSDFTRAFIRWTGMNPSGFRETYLNDKNVIYDSIAFLRERDLR